MGDKSWQPVRMDLREAKPPREPLGWWDPPVLAQRMVEKGGGTWGCSGPTYMCAHHLGVILEEIHCRADAKVSCLRSINL